MANTMCSGVEICSVRNTYIQLDLTNVNRLCLRFDCGLIIRVSYTGSVCSGRGHVEACRCPALADGCQPRDLVLSSVQPRVARVKNLRVTRGLGSGLGLVGLGLWLRSSSGGLSLRWYHFKNFVREKPDFSFRERIPLPHCLPALPQFCPTGPAVQKAG